MDKNESAINVALNEIKPKSDWYRWAKRMEMYIEREELRDILDKNEKSVLVVDVRDDDNKGGNIRGAIHVPDASFKASSVCKIMSVMKEKGASTVVFHCMESARRGPRCAKRMCDALNALREKTSPIEIRVLVGGFDQWIRAYIRERRDLIENFDDDYWGFFFDDGDKDNHARDEEEPKHRLYVRPSDQQETPWSAAGASARTKGTPLDKINSE